MFQELFNYPGVLARHKNAPFAEERERYLSHRVQEGCAKETLLRIARELLCIVRELKITPLGVTREEIKVAANRLARRQHRRRRARCHRWSYEHFISVATQWLRFIGLLREPAMEPGPFADLIEDFGSWMRTERGLSSKTIRNQCWHAAKFLRWYGTRYHLISMVQITDVDTFLAEQGTGGWSRVSLAGSAKALRAFFRHAEMRGWCPAPIAGAIEGPRLFAQETLPVGPAWEDVRRLIASMDTDRPNDIRNRAIVMLFSIYGFRSSEVSGLRLEDIDWEHDQIMVRRPKQRLSQTYPLVPIVGDAIIRYLWDVRPKCSLREIFLTLRAPFRHISAGGLYHMTVTRMIALGVSSYRQGPHSLRHACAAHLISEGLSFKEIGDHLGHKSTSATRIYAKVDMRGLREVADFDLGGVL